MSEQSSNTSQTASAFYDPDSWCWRTSQGSLLSEEYPLLERLPDWGTTADGALCVQAIPEHLTGVRDGSALLGTPTTATSGRSAEFRRGAAPNPQELAALLPTPMATGEGCHRDLEALIAKGQQIRLTEVIRLLLPTPVVNDMGRGKTISWWDDWTAKIGGHGDSLDIEMRRLLPTSAPTTKPSDDGNTSSDDQHQPPPMIEDSDPSSSSG